MKPAPLARVRCGRCERVLRNPHASRGLNHRERAERERLEAIPTTGATADAYLDLMTGRGRPLAESGDVERRGDEYVLRLSCPDCRVHYAAVVKELRSRQIEAGRRGEDVILTAADHDPRSGVS